MEFLKKQLLPQPARRIRPDMYSDLHLWKLTQEVKFDDTPIVPELFGSRDVTLRAAMLVLQYWNILEQRNDLQSRQFIVKSLLGCRDMVHLFNKKMRQEDRYLRELMVDYIALRFSAGLLGTKWNRRPTKLQGTAESESAYVCQMLVIRSQRHLVAALEVARLRDHEYSPKLTGSLPRPCVLYDTNMVDDKYYAEMLRALLASLKEINSGIYIEDDVDLTSSVELDPMELVAMRIVLRTEVTQIEVETDKYSLIFDRDAFVLKCIYFEQLNSTRGLSSFQHMKNMHRPEMVDSIRNIRCYMSYVNNNFWRHNDKIDSWYKILSKLCKQFKIDSPRHDVSTGLADTVKVTLDCLLCVIRALGSGADLDEKHMNAIADQMCFIIF